jgi:hypothetical protein
MLKTNCILLKKAEKTKPSDILMPGVISYPANKKADLPERRPA